MSYAHYTTKPTKAEAKADLMRQFDEITLPMFPVHSRDRAAVEANIDSALAQLPDDSSKHVGANINGYMSYSAGTNGENVEVHSIGITAGASLIAPPADKPKA